MYQVLAQEYYIAFKPLFWTMGIALIVIWIVFNLQVDQDEKKAKLLIQYRSLALDDNYATVGQIAEAVGREPHQTKSALRFLIDQGLLPMAIDDAGNVVYDESYGMEGEQAEEESLDEPAEDEETGDNAYNDSEQYDDEVVVACDGCGAKARLHAGKVEECAYCGSPVKAS